MRGWGSISNRTPCATFVDIAPDARMEARPCDPKSIDLTLVTPIRLTVLSATVLAWIGMLGAVSCSPPAYDCTGCNVIVISIDTLRADHLGCYGYPRETTPSVDAFSREALLFRNSFSHAPSTEPSHGSIFTSQIPVHHGGLRAQRLPISPGVPTMPEMLRDAGYRTLSWNGGGQVAASYGFDRGFEVYESTVREERFRGRVASAIEWLDANPGEKFFFFLHTYEVHNPYSPEPRYLEMFDTGYDGDLPASILPGLLLDINDGRFSISGEDAQHIVNTYDAEIRSVDDAFGELVAALDERELLERTVIVFTSDHGEEFGEHGSVGRHSHSLYDELLRVPLILWLPGSEHAGGQFEQQVRGIDILPTVLDAVGIEIPETLAGKSLLPLIAGQDGAPRLTVSQLDVVEPQLPTSIRDGRQKLVVGPPIFDEEVSLRWFRDEAQIAWTAPHLHLSVVSPAGERWIEITVDGKPHKRVNVGTTARRVVVNLPEEGGGSIGLRSLAPCIDTTSAGLDIEEECVGFGIYNTSEYYRLDTDPGERDNLYGDSRHATEIEALRTLLDTALGSRPDAVAGRGAVELDPETEEHLRDLGYID